MNIKILFEDENILVVDKPAGVLVYPISKNTKEKTIIDLLHKKLQFSPKRERNGVVHRLDRDTSGVLLLAKNTEAESKLKSLFKNRKIIKNYQTLVWGEPKPSQGEIRIPLGRASKDRLKIVPSPGGKQAITIYKLLKYYKKTDQSLLEVNLKTGRTHQIRVHMSAIGYPVVGDRKYSKKQTPLKRQFLHASKIEFVNPFNGKVVSISDPLPFDLNEYLTSIN